MADEVRTTQYLFEFAEKGMEATQQKIQGFVNNLKQYEAQMEESMRRMESLGSRGATTPQVAQATGVSSQVIQEQERAIQQSQQAVKQFEADQSKLVQAMLATGSASSEGAGKLTFFHEQFRDGNRRIKEYEKVLNDTNKTVERGKIFFDRSGKEIGRMTQVTATGADGVRRMKTEIEGLNRVTEAYDVLGSRFVRHLTWIGQGIIAWQAINFITQGVSDWYQAQVQLNSALVDFELRTMASSGQLDDFRQQILEISKLTATKPSELAPVAPYAKDEATLDYAAQLNRVAGGNLQNQMQWLVAQQRQFNLEGEDTAKILTAMYSAWRQTTLPMDQFVTMLRDAAPLAQEFNLSMEEMYTLFGAMQAVTGAEGRELDYLSRNFQRLYDPSVQQKLGIVTTPIGPSGEMQVKDLITVLDELNQKIQQGEITFSQAADAMGATGRRQKQMFQSLMLDWDGVIASMQNSMSVPANWADAFETAMGKDMIATEQLKSAWERLLLTIGDTGVITSTFTLITEGLEGIIGLLTGDWKEAWKKAQEGGTFWKMPWEEAEIRAQAEASMGTPSGGFGATATAGLPQRQYEEGPAPLPSFPGIVNLPEGLSFEGLMRAMDQWTAAFSALGPDFEAYIQQNQDTALVYDENTKTLREITGFLPALQRAISENTQAQKESALQPGLRNVDMNLDQQGGLLQQWVQYYTDFLNRMGFPQEQRPQLVLGQDDTFLRLWASNEALMLALRALTEATEDQTDILSGMWNVPEGATMWVPIQSLFYSRKQGGDTSLPGGFLPPPSTLPPQQPDWMSLPGAVESMSVGTMSVTNLEGLTSLVVPGAGATAGIEGDVLAQIGTGIKDAFASMDITAIAGSLSMATAGIGSDIAAQVGTGMKNAIAEIGAGTTEVISGLTEQQRIFSEAITAFKERAAPGTPEPNWEMWARALSQAITSFRERSGGVGMPEPDWAQMDVSRLFQQISTTPWEIKPGSLEIQSPTTEMITPQAQMTTVSTSVTTPSADMLASNVNLLAGTLSGLPEMDTGNIEALLTNIYTVNTMVLQAIQSINITTYAPPPSNPDVYPTQVASAPPAIPGGTPNQIASVPTPEQVGRFVQEKNYWDFTNYSRIRTAF